MAIKTGIGVGAAQVADTSNIMNAYARQIAQQQMADAILAERQAKEATALAERREKEEAKYNEELADLIAGIKTEGARDEDLPDITNSYNEIKELYRRGTSLKDPAQKALFRAELGKNIKALNEYAQRSNKFSRDLYALGSDIAKNEWDYDPASVSYLNKIKRLSLKDLGQESIIDPMKFKRLPNFGLIDTVIDDVYKTGKEQAKFAGEKIEKGKRFNVNRVEPAIIQNNLIQRIQNNPEVAAAVKSLYVRETGDNEITGEKLTNFIRSKYETKHGYDYIGEARDLKERKGDGDEQDKYTYRQQIITGALNNDNASINKILAALPVGSKIVPMISIKGKSNQGGAKGGYKQLQITIPQGVDAKGNPLPELNQIVEASRGEGVIKLNRILNTYTGENISDSKLGIKGGKTAGEQIAVNLPKSQSSKITKIKVQLPDGTTGEINSDQLKAFMEKYPKAKQLK